MAGFPGVDDLREFLQAGLNAQKALFRSLL